MPSQTHIRVVKGPLTDDALMPICKLYGRQDRRYAGLEFSRRVFNDNVGGFSYHACAYDGELLVGHYAVVPVPIVLHQERRLSGKGEALFVDDAYRKHTVDFDGVQTRISQAMIAAAHRVSIEEFDLVHVFTHEKAGHIFMATGMKKRPLAIRTTMLRLAPASSSNRSFRDTLRAAGGGALATYSKTASRALTSAWPAPAPVEPEEMPPALDADTEPSRLLRTLQFDSAKRGGVWGVSLDRANLAWNMHVRGLRVAHLKSVDGLALYLPGGAGSFQVVDLACSRPSLSAQANIVSFLLAQAMRERAAVVAFSEEAFGRLSHRTVLLLRALGGITRVTELNTYVVSKRPEYEVAPHYSFLLHI